MTTKGSELIFISRILRDGSGVEPISDQENMQKWFSEDEFKLIRLSLSQDTYIASGFNSYVVKKKEANPHE